MPSKIAIIGAGAWGTAVGKVAAEKGNDVLMWSSGQENVRDINSRRENVRRLPGVRLPENLRADRDLERCLDGREFIVLALPSIYLLETVKRMLSAPSIREGEAAIAVITKGFLPGDKGPRLIVEVLEDYLPGFYRNSLVYIAGPSHAEEVSRGKITGLIAASENGRNALRFRDLLKGRGLFVFPSLDVRGVQVAAATKNVIAIAFGMLDAFRNSAAGLRGELAELAGLFGDGTESLLLAAGLNEIQALGMAMGATHPETFTSISGIGDLDVTCRSVFGRNRRFGKEIVEKDILAPFADIDSLISGIGGLDYLPEGVAAAKYVKQLADRHELAMPISCGIFRLLNRELSPPEFLEGFFRRFG